MGGALGEGRRRERRVTTSQTQTFLLPLSKKNTVFVFVFFTLFIFEGLQVFVFPFFSSFFPLFMIIFFRVCGLSYCLWCVTHVFFG